jgi:hypothetical protein
VLRLVLVLVLVAPYGESRTPSTSTNPDYDYEHEHDYEHGYEKREFRVSECRLLSARTWAEAQQIRVSAWPLGPPDFARFISPGRERVERKGEERRGKERKGEERKGEERFESRSCS